MGTVPEQDSPLAIEEPMMSNPELMRMASESMKNMRPEDFKLAAEQLKRTRPEQMAEIGEKMPNATPEEIAAACALAYAQMKYEISEAEMLKKKGNELHSQGRFHEAIQKYCLAKQNLTEIPSSQSRKLLLSCMLSLMSCYLKTGQYDECVKEGSEVLAYDAKNLKALFRRGQAYKELGLLKDAVSDLSMACEVCPDDDTVSKLLRETKEMLAEDGGKHAPRECMKNMRLEDFKLAAEQLKHICPEQMAEIGEEMANATPKAVAAMFALANALMKCEVSGAEMLKKQGNELHRQRRFHEAMQKYCLAKQNLRGIPSSQSRKLLVACSLNLMSCYLKIGQYDECVKEGSEVLAYDAKNLKALYRRGQAYKELGLLKDAVSDLSMACEGCPDDDTVSKRLRETKAMLAEDGGEHAPKGLVFEEITEEDQNVLAQNSGSSSVEQTTAKPKIWNTSSKNSSTVIKDNLKSNMEGLNALENDPEAIRSFQNFISNADPATLISLNAGQSKDMSPDMIRTASNMISKMSPLELQKMLDMASSDQGGNPFLRGPPNSIINSGSIPPNVTPDMIKTASDMTSKMPPLDLQERFVMASSMAGKASSSSSAAVDENLRNASQSNFPASNANGSNAFTESSSCLDLLLNMINAALSNFSSSSTDLLELMRNQMNDPAMRQMFTSMIKTASDMTSKMPPLDLQERFVMASSMAGKASSSSSAAVDENLRNASQSNFPASNANGSNAFTESSSCLDSLLNMINAAVSNFPSSSTDLLELMRNQMNDPAMRQMFTSMIKTASDMTSKMPPLDLQERFVMASSMAGKASSSSSAAVDENLRNASQSNFPASNANGSNAFTESSSCLDSLLNMINAALSNFPSSSTDLLELMRNQMNDPAMRQMFTSMITNMSPDMMANMGELFGVKLSKEDAAKAQQALSSLSPESLDRMVRWADRVQKGVEGAKKTKNWLLGKPDLILAIVMLILAAILKLI